MNLCLMENTSFKAETKIRKVVIGDIHPCKIDYMSWSIPDITKSLVNMDLSKIKTRRDADEMLKNEINSPLMRGFLLANLKDEDGKWEWQMGLKEISDNLINIHEFKEYKSQYENPILFLKGGNSSGLRESHFEKIKLYFPNYELYTFNDTGHWLNYEKPDEFFEITNKFLND
jgi:esterase